MILKFGAKIGENSVLMRQFGDAIMRIFCPGDDQIPGPDVNNFPHPDKGFHCINFGTSSLEKRDFRLPAFAHLQILTSAHWY